MKNKKSIWTKWLYWFTFAVAVIAVYKTLDSFSEIGRWISNFLNVIMPFILGIIIAYVLYIPAKKVESLFKKIKKVKFFQNKARVLSVIVVYICVIFILILVINYLIPIVCTSVIDFANHFQEYYTIIMNKLNNLPEDSILSSEAVTNTISKIGQIDIMEYINIEKISLYAQGAISIFTGIFKFFVAIIVSAYILLERGEIINFAKKLVAVIFDEKACKNVEKYFHRTNEIFLKFIASQLLDGIVVGVLTSIAMSILGVKYAVLLGIMIGLFNMIPYFGAIIAVIIATIITFITGGATQAVWMLIIITILQQIDANIINPKIVGESLKISPLLVIFAVTVGGAYFDVLGMFLAVPIAAIIKVVLVDYIEPRGRRNWLKMNHGDRKPTGTENPRGRSIWVVLTQMLRPRGLQFV